MVRAPLERKAFNAPMKLGFSQITASPSLQNALHASSMPCCPPVVTIVWSNSRPMPNFSKMRAAIDSRSGA